ncbi:MAG TPA: LysM peptidoglycan-binding domain-containing protein [Acidimicrobiales bacterium]
MAAVEVIQSEGFEETQNRPHLRLVSTPEVYRIGPSLARRRAARARMMQRRRRTLVGLLLVTGLVILSWPGHAFGGTTGGGLSTDMANSSVLASGMEYVVQPGDTVRSIATLMNPVNPAAAQIALVREIHSSVVVPGEHVLIP